jgi:hypothetical protein
LDSTLVRKTLTLVQNQILIEIKKQITNNDINNWYKNTPVVKYLALDYKNAKQAIYQGRMVVKIPVLNENKFPFNTSSDKKVESTNKTSNIQNPEIKKGAYFAQHPPEVFLVKDEKDSLHSALLNFIPDNQTNGFGQNGIWTGKLYEWNMNSDSIFVLEINQNNIIKRLIFKKVNQSSELGSSNIKSDSFWNFLRNIVDVIGEFFNDVGFFLGIPGSFGFFPGEGWGSSNINDVGGDYGGGGGGGGGGGSFGSGGSSFDFYNYWFPANGGGGNYQEYPIDDPTHGPSVPSTPAYRTLETEILINELAITDNYIIQFLDANPTISTALENFVSINGGFTTDNKNFISWAMYYLFNNSNVDFEDFKNEYLINQPNINNVILPSLIDTTGLSAYPKFKEIITNLPGFLNTYPNVKKALAFYTGFTEAEVMSKMQPGKGPKIILSSNFPSTKYGHYNALNKTLELNINYINGLEAAQSSKTIQATALLLAITTFHEFVHYGRNFNKLTYDFINPNNGVSTEAGWTFEQNIDPAGLGINKYRAIKWLEFYNFNF